VAAAPVEAPAKINLGLRIRGRRADGYHELESVFLPLDLADEVRVEASAGEGVSLALDGDAAGVPGGDANLALRAARAFAEAAGLGEALAVRLRKRIPAAAGLGGGSSDAASPPSGSRPSP
jgi:4-diphosphocytidyl-2-C-methyl-D-erythritol kinase